MFFSHSLAHFLKWGLLLNLESKNLSRLANSLQVSGTLLLVPRHCWNYRCSITPSFWCEFCKSKLRSLCWHGGTLLKAVSPTLCMDFEREHLCGATPLDSDHFHFSLPDTMFKMYRVIKWLIFFLKFWMCMLLRMKFLATSLNWKSRKKGTCISDIVSSS